MCTSTGRAETQRVDRVSGRKPSECGWGGRGALTALQGELQVHGNPSLRVPSAQLDEIFQLAEERRRGTRTLFQRSGQRAQMLIGAVADERLQLQGAAGIRDPGGHVAVGADGALRSGLVLNVAPDKQKCSLGDLNRKGTPRLERIVDELVKRFAIPAASARADVVDFRKSLETFSLLASGPHSSKE